MDEFAARLRLLREQRSLTQRDLASATEIHYTQINRYEKGVGLPAAGALKRLADFFNVPVDYLVHGVTDEAARTSLDDRELLLQFQEVQKLPADDKDMVKRVVNAFLLKRKLQDLQNYTAL